MNHSKAHILANALSCTIMHSYLLLRHLQITGLFLERNNISGDIKNSDSVRTRIRLHIYMHFQHMVGIVRNKKYLWESCSQATHKVGFFLHRLLTLLRLGNFCNSWEVKLLTGCGAS